jgi:hypothetical protein
VSDASEGDEGSLTAVFVANTAIRAAAHATAGARAGNKNGIDGIL